MSFEEKKLVFFEEKNCFSNQSETETRWENFLGLLIFYVLREYGIDISEVGKGHELYSETTILNTQVK